MRPAGVHPTAPRSGVVYSQNTQNPLLLRGHCPSDHKDIPLPERLGAEGEGGWMGKEERGEGGRWEIGTRRRNLQEAEGAEGGGKGERQEWEEGKKEGGRDRGRKVGKWGGIGGRKVGNGSRGEGREGGGIEGGRKKR